MVYPLRQDRAPESALKDYISQALVLAASRQAFNLSLESPELENSLGKRFENLRWFELPVQSLNA
jgi:hypothetical protein